MTRERAEDYFIHGKGNDLSLVKGSLWAAYNGVVEYIDYEKYQSASENRQIEAIWFGSGYSVKARAFRAAESLAGNWAH